MIMTPKAMSLWLLMMIVLFVCSNCKLSEANSDRVTNQDISIEEDLELENELKLLNKPSIITFQTEEGDIIDCVDINKQPALDHPLLKNHKIQTRPSRHPVGWTSRSSKSESSLLRQTKREACPVGSVPIKRTLKKDLIRLRSSNSKSRSEQQIIDEKATTIDAITFPFDKNVVSLALKKGINYYGASARVAVYNLSVTQDQSSSANLWIVGGPPESPNVLLAGWQVNPAINGDGLTRMFVYWTVDGGVKTGCYNMLCRGFVQTDRRVTPDLPLYPTSTYRGQQNEYPLLIYQDRKSGAWWVVFAESRTAIGYWPKELFTHLSDGAEKVGWGGIAEAGKNTGMSPPLGNGHMPNGQYDEACYFRSMNYIQGNNEGEFPMQINTVPYSSNYDCYGLNNNMNCGDPQLYYCFTFGGPGGSNCKAHPN